MYLRRIAALAILSTGLGGVPMAMSTAVAGEVLVEVQTSSQGVPASDSARLTTRKAMNKGAELSLVATSSSSSAGAKIGRLSAMTMASSAVGGATTGSAHSAFGNMVSEDEIVVTAPGFPAGYPVRYVATMKVDATTAATVLADADNYNSTAADISIIFAIVDGGTVEDTCILTANESCKRTLRLEYDTVVGASFSIIAQVYSSAGVRREAKKSLAQASLTFKKPSRIILRTNVVGANITGKSGYVYD